MAFASLRELLNDAAACGYAVGAFNINNMEIIQAVLEVADEVKAPVILQASQGAIRYAGLEYIHSLVVAGVKKVRVPVALHLDHGTSFKQIIQCIRHGFTSIMFDGSSFPLEENIALTKKIVEVAHAAEVSVEAELGRIGGAEDEIEVSAAEEFFTDPEEARHFVRNTGVDALAVAIGTAHGPYRGEPRLDFRRLALIKELVDVPLVLHGASGVPDESIGRAIELGICKVNIDTEIRQAFARGVTAVLRTNPSEYDPRKILAPAKEEMKKVIRRKMHLFRCAGTIK